ncbi:DoxX family protein [Paenibacillus beijingensis]|uniref:Oxidoreductase n=1 Tax=Paenibacillus beijingensis TaxID=1126833 RepID=A0A0D5NH21_9BACL|nr:DoxX family protein [Paenibacillus beijingensis]AJY74669.1 oxidoreductase [Paenibacillus beijingensis]
MGKNVEIGTLIARVVLGIIFMLHGWQKAQNFAGTSQFFQKIGLPGFMAYAVGTIELIGGILLIIGFGTRIIAALFALIMLGAIFQVKSSAGLVGGYELDLALLAISVHLMLAGGGLLAADKLLFRGKARTANA